MASMFDTIADMLRGSAPDDLAHALGTDRTQTRRAMEIGLPALITGLRDKTLEPGGAQNLASMLDEPSAAVPADLDGYLAAGDPAQGAAMLDVAFGDRGEPALAALSSASGLSTRLLAQVMSVLAPLATGTVGALADHSPESLRSYLSTAVEDLEGKGFGRVVDLVSPAGVGDHADVVSIDPVASPTYTPDVDASDEADLAGVADLDADAALVAADDLGEASDDDFLSGDIETDVEDHDPLLASQADSDRDATVVEGAFGGTDDLVLLDEMPPEVDLGDSTQALELGDDMPSFEAEVANVAPAGVAIAPDLGAETDFDSPTVALADADLPDVEGDDLKLEGQGLSGMGWLWWLIGAVLGIAILLFLISQCGGSDDGTTVATDTTATATQVDPTPDPAVVQRQATLDRILVDYPAVTGEVFGDVAVLNGTVADETERALLDQAVRAAGLNVQNNVTANQAAASPDQGFSINDLIDTQPELSTLRALLDQAGLGQALDGNGEFTLFAPTNEAFGAISEQVTELQNDPQALQDVLKYHLLVGAQDSAAISNTTSVPTQLDGQNIAVSSDGGAIVLNGSSSVLVEADRARNGVMYIVSQVLLPELASEFPEEIGAELGLAPITFALGSSDLTDAGKVELDKVVAFLLATPGNIEIGGHTDADGEPGFNQTLSQDRAGAVKSYLEANGIPGDSLTAVGFGEDQPIAPNDTPENKAKNRRIEFRPN